MLRPTVHVSLCCCRAHLHTHSTVPALHTHAHIYCNIFTYLFRTFRHVRQSDVNDKPRLAEWLVGQADKERERKGGRKRGERGTDEVASWLVDWLTEWPMPWKSPPVLAWLDSVPCSFLQLTFACVCASVSVRVCELIDWLFVPHHSPGKFNWSGNFN